MWKLEEVSHEMLVLMLQHVCLVSSLWFPAALPRLWGKWQAQCFCVIFRRWVAVFVAGRHSTLFTPHVTLYNLHYTPTLQTSNAPTLHTLHLTLYTLHIKNTSHFTLYTLHFTLHTLHSRLYTLHSTLYTLHCRLYTLHSTLYNPHFTLHTLQSTLYSPHSTL